ncbi:uncharacterized protein [Ptychodera flava]|uniref:uncharacterized protein n=1 Tax=Ptychodera flava TaxID=63121 RepID=UPI00396A936D
MTMTMYVFGVLTIWFIICPGGMCDQTTANLKNSQVKRILILHDEWEKVYKGTSNLNRQIDIEAKEAGFEVYRTVLGRDGCCIDVSDAKEHYIKVADNICHRNINLDCLQTYSECNLSEIEKIEDLDVIIGHVPVTSGFAISLTERKFKTSRVLLFISDHHEDMEEYQPEYYEAWESNLIKAAEKATAVFSVGPKVFSVFDRKFKALSESIKHCEYLPFPKDDIFNITVNAIEAGEDNLMQVLTYEHMIGVENMKDYYMLIAKAFSRVAKTYHDMHRLLPKFIIKGVPSQHHDDIRTTLYKRLTVQDKYLKIKLPPYGTYEKNLQDIKESNLVVLSSRSEPFGIAGLQAMAVGIPVLVTSHSGLAEFIKKEFPHEASQMTVKVGVNDIDVEGDIDTWRDHIIDVLCYNYTALFEVARDLKEKLKESKLIQESRKRFKDALKDTCLDSW